MKKMEEKTVKLIIAKNGRNDRELLTILKKRFGFETCYHEDTDTDGKVSDLTDSEVISYLYDVFPDWLSQEHDTNVFWENERLYECSDM